MYAPTATIACCYYLFNINIFPDEACRRRSVLRLSIFRCCEVDVVQRLSCARSIAQSILVGIKQFLSICLHLLHEEPLFFSFQDTTT